MQDFIHNMYSLDPTEDRPDIFVYRDPYSYLNDICQWARQQDKRLSFRRIALEAELGSPNYVQQYIKGKRHFKDDTAQRVARVLGMRGDEIRFWLLLNRFAQALRINDKRTLYRQILALAIANGAGQLDQLRLKYFSHWYVPVMHAMASLVGFEPDPVQIAHNIVPKISLCQSREAFAILQDLGIFGSCEKGCFVLREPQLSTSPEIRSIWLREYHDAMIGLATDAIERWDSQNRNASSLTVTVKSDQVSWLLKKIDDFRNELFAELMGSQEKDDLVEGDVFQINFQAYPVTSYTRKPEPKNEPKNESKITPKGDHT